MKEKELLLMEKVKKWIDDADAIVVGIGSGLSASAGLDYTSEEVCKHFYPEYYKMGFKCIFDIISLYWTMDRCSPEQYWSFWARHIKEIRFDPPALRPYQDLAEILKGKNYFVINTNVDGQYEKSKLDNNRVFAPQGNYNLLQCSLPCSNDVYEDKEIIEKMVKNMPDEFHIRSEDVPKCPHCGRCLVPNLRGSDTFVEKPHMEKRKEYQKFIEDNMNKNILFLEIGVGFNSPGVIRTPFNYMTYEIPKAKLIRMNLNDPEVPYEIRSKTIVVKDNIKTVLAELKEM